MDLKLIYDKFPSNMQNLACAIQGIILKRQRYNNAFENHLALLNRQQWETENQINIHKEKELIRLLETCYKYVPYYTSTFKKARVTPNDFKSLVDIQKF